MRGYLEDLIERDRDGNLVKCELKQFCYKLEIK